MLFCHGRYLTMWAPLVEALRRIPVPSITGSTLTGTARSTGPRTFRTAMARYATLWENLRDLIAIGRLYRMITTTRLSRTKKGRDCMEAPAYLLLWQQLAWDTKGLSLLDAHLIQMGIGTGTKNSTKPCHGTFTALSGWVTISWRGSTSCSNLNRRKSVQ